MASKNKRLEYESLKAVLQSLDFNKRLQLRLHVPSIRTVDKLLPFKLQKLSFNFLETKINNTTYDLAIDRQLKARTSHDHQAGSAYTFCNRLTIQSPNNKTVERVELTQSIFCAQEYISSVIFANSKSPIYVWKAIFETSEYLSKIKIKTKTIELGLCSGWEWKNVIHESSWSLNTVRISMNSTAVGRLNQDFVRDARKLVISNVNLNPESWIRIIQNLKNPTIVLKNESRADTIDDYIRLVKNWMETGRPIGTSLEFGFKRDETCIHILGKIKFHLNAVWNDYRNIVLEMNDGSELRISCERIQKKVPEKGSQKEESTWALRMSVV